MWICLPSFTDAQCLSTSVSTTNNKTEVTTCPGDGRPDVVRFKPNTWAAGYVWVITDENNTITDFFYGNKYDFENLGAGVSRVWGVSHSGIVTVPVGENILSADFQAFCWIVSINFVKVKRVIPDGATVSLANGGTLTYVCAGDGAPDVVSFANNSQAGNDYAYVIADENGTILAAADASGSYDFDGLPLGTCRVYGFGYTGNATITPGENVATSELSDNCYDLSDNFVEVVKDVPNGGTVATAGGSDFVQVCVGDGNASVVGFSASNTSNLFYAWVLTDENNQFLALETQNEHDFEGAPAGTCRVYGVAYVGNFVISAGEDIFANDLTDDCFDLSDNYIEVLRSEPNGSFVSLDDGTEKIFTCPGDGVADVVSFSTSSGSTAQYAFLITDEAGQILDVTTATTHDFDGAPTGICRIYGVSYVGNLLAEAGQDIFTDALSDDCWDLSNNYIEVVREVPDGGEIATAIGETVIYQCPNDGQPDLVDFETVGISNSNHLFAVTDENLQVVNLIQGNSFDFENLDPGIYRVYAIAYTGNFTMIEGDFLFVTPISDDCADISDNYITLIREAPDAGMVFANGGQEILYTCPQDGKADLAQLENPGASNARYAYLVLDENLQVAYILTDDDLFDFDMEAPGLYAVYGVSYTGELTIQPGDDPFINPLSDDCYELSENWVDVVHFAPAAGTLSTTDGLTEVEVCSGDGTPDLVGFEVAGEAPVRYMYVATDTTGKILSFSPVASMDFESVNEGVCRIYGVSYTGNFLGIVGENIHDLLLSDDCFDLSDNYIEVTRIEVDGGQVATAPHNDTQVFICPGDGVPNLLSFATTSAAPSDHYIYIITDNNQIITHILTDDQFDFDPLGIGVSKVWGLSYTGNLLAQPGDDLSQTALSDGCFALSENAIEVTRDTPNGDIIVSNQGDDISICVGDGKPDEIGFLTGSFSFAPYLYIITDEFNEIIEIMDDNVHDFENLPAATCRVWGLSYTGHLTAQPGDLLDFDALSDDCFDLSDNFIQIHKTFVDGATVFSPSGNELYICVGDGNSDFTGFFNTSNSGNEYRYLITDEAGNLLDVVGFNLYNFENGDPGICRVYGLDFTGVFSAFVGDNIFEDDLSTECFELSSDFLTVHKGQPDGGTLATDDGKTSVTVLVNDGQPDTIRFVATGASDLKYRFILTDENDVILDILTTDFADFENAGEGICRVYGLAYTNNLTAQPGMVLTDISPASGCYDLSDNFIEIIRDDPNNLTNPGDAGTFIFTQKQADFFQIRTTPNPVRNRLRIEWQSADYEGPAQLEIYHASGARIQSSDLEMTRGNNQFELQTEGWAPGAYFIVIRHQQETSQAVFLKI
ncbi:MAG: T9SS C-terminal target domain-containing protein [Bacteroidetes bacterium]|nr:MAG: T9SS C-terminal target domain-containing protein [Bacteroidota bacterium]